MTARTRLTSETAQRLDLDDPLSEFRGQFVGASTDGVLAYLDGNSLGRPVVGSDERLRTFVQEQWGDRLIRSWDEQWMLEPTRLGDRLAEITLGARAGQTFIGDSTSVLLYKLVRSALSSDDTRDEIVIDRDNFPTDRFVLEGIATEHGATIRWVDVDPTAGVTCERLEPLLSPRTALVVLSHVAYRSGFLADAPAITNLVHEAGALMLWDLCHSVGAVPIELDTWNVDLAVGCTYKYLNGGPGSPAFGFVREDLQVQLQQPIWGWMGSADPFAMTGSYSPADGIRRFLSGTPSILAMQPMEDMLTLIERAGMDAIRRKSIQLTELAIDLFDSCLAPLGVSLASPRDSIVRGSHITIDHPRFAEVTEILWSRGVIPDYRPPGGMRIGLSPLSTSYRELDIGVREIQSVLESLS